MLFGWFLGMGLVLYSLCLSFGSFCCFWLVMICEMVYESIQGQLEKWGLKGIVQLYISLKCEL